MIDKEGATKGPDGHEGDQMGPWETGHRAHARRGQLRTVRLWRAKRYLAKKGNLGMATRQTERPGPRREKKQVPRGEGAGLKGKKEIKKKGKGEWRRKAAPPRV
jgi:hypothetical protein